MMEQDRYIGQQIGNYRLVAQLDYGLVRCVYRAEHLILKKRTVAITILLRTHLATQQKREGFFQEAALLEMLKHPHILPLLDVGIQDGFPYLVTEYCSEGSLHRRLKRQRPHRLPMEEASTILTQVGRALQYLHEQGVVHGNLRPKNILFNAKGEALLTDFGINMMLETIGRPPVTFGPSPPTHTVEYIAPEQLNGTASKESDQYALGCIAYELFTGRPPFTGDTIVDVALKHIHEQPIAPRQLNPQLPVHIEQPILTALAKEREARHADVATFITALQKTAQ
jgi:serine/threonine protein kinase